MATSRGQWMRDRLQLHMGEAHRLRHPVHGARVLNWLRRSEMAASAGFPDQPNKFPDDLI